MLENPRGKVVYTKNGQTITLPFGPGRTDGNGLVIDFTQTDNRLTVNLLPTEPVVLRTLAVDCALPIYAHDRLYANGYQSWTLSRELKPDDSIQPLHPLAQWLITAYGDYDLWPYSGQKGDLHAWSYAYLKREGVYHLLASLAEHTGYTVIQLLAQKNRAVLHKDCDGRKISSPWLALDVATHTGPDLHALILAWQAQLGLPRVQHPPVTGWTSWYYHYTGISQQIIDENIRAYRDLQLPIDLFQIDDGWQPAVGDWRTHNAKFPDGMQALASRIHDHGWKAGLWMAPFATDHKSFIWKEKRDWVLKDKKGKPVVAGFNPGWGGWLHGYFYALDIRKPEVQDYVRQVLSQAVHTWGFDLLKLDFLYSAAFCAGADMTHGEVMRMGMQLLRDAVGPDKLLLGCGVPLLPATGLVDYCRIGPDVGLTWETGYLKFARYRERISSVNAIHNALSRAHLDGLSWGNDPDVFILREEKQDMRIPERESLYLANLIAGTLVFTSDNPALYSPETLARYRAGFPHRGKTIRSMSLEQDVYRVSFGWNGLEYLAYFNTSEDTARLRTGGQLMYDPVHQGFLSADTEFALGPRQSLLLYQVPAVADTPVLAGGTGHVFPGMDVETMTTDTDGNLRLALHPHASRAGKLLLRVAEGTENLTVNGKEYPVVQAGPLWLADIPCQAL